MQIDDLKTVAVIGAGDMGHGIAEAALIAGYRVHLRDVNAEFLDRGLKRIHDSLQKLVDKGKVEATRYEAIRSDLLRPCTDLKEAVREADLVIEAIPEIMELKQETFREVDEAAPPHALLASNTSTMSISEISGATGRPDRMLGLHSETGGCGRTPERAPGCGRARIHPEGRGLQGRHRAPRSASQT